MVASHEARLLGGRSNEPVRVNRAHPPCRCLARRYGPRERQVKPEDGIKGSSTSASCGQIQFASCGPWSSSEPLSTVVRAVQRATHDLVPVRLRAAISRIREGYMAEELFVEGLKQAVQADPEAHWEVGETSMTKLPAEEREAQLGFTPPPGEPSLEEMHAAIESGEAAREDVPAASVGAPASFDLRNVGGKSYVTGVKNQGGCGSCVVFGTAASVESTAALRPPRSESRARSLGSAMVLLLGESGRP